MDLILKIFFCMAKPYKLTKSENKQSSLHIIVITIYKFLLLKISMQLPDE